ncbi:hypothetical protein Tco_1384276 [Tanacetum coccineum]
MVSENDYDKVNMPSFPPPEPKVSYFDDLDFLKDFENEFPAIVYNNALTSKSDFSTEPVEIPHHMALPPRDQRHKYLRFEGLQYTDGDIVDFETRLGKIYMRKGQSVFTSRAWGQLFEIQGPLVHKLILGFFSTFRFGEVVVDLDTAGALHSVWATAGKQPGLENHVGVGGYGYPALIALNIKKGA